MAKEVKQDPEEELEAAEEQPKKSRKKPFLTRFLTRKWLAILVGISVVGHGIGFAYYQLISKASAQSLSAEVGLGMFRFEAAKNEDGRIAAAEFSIHIALLDQVNQVAQRRLRDRRFRIQQDVEELLRQAHSGDFDDPNLGELKRQLQEQVNETLGMRAIADVIITNLQVEQREGDAGTATSTAETVPWVEKPAS